MTAYSEVIHPSGLFETCCSRFWSQANPLPGKTAIDTFDKAAIALASPIIMFHSAGQTQA